MVCLVSGLRRAGSQVTKLKFKSFSESESVAQNNLCAPLGTNSSQHGIGEEKERTQQWEASFTGRNVDNRETCGSREVDTPCWPGEGPVSL